jgi:hypothetical protein
VVVSSFIKMSRARLVIEPVTGNLDSLVRAGRPIHLSSALVDKKTRGRLPAMSRWFEELGNGSKMLNGALWTRHAGHVVEMELRQSLEPQFSRFGAPIGLFLQWQEQKLSRSPNQVASMKDIALYIAQSSLDSLPAALRKDIPTPPDIAESDVYASSLWLGIPPTRTPLHKDPNDNLFVQLSGTKVFRLLKPEDGITVFGDKRVRTEEDLMGTDAEEIELWLWNEEQTASEVTPIFTCWEATVNENEGLYIPRGWWHSVRGVGAGINTSVSCIFDKTSVSNVSR